MLYVFHFSTITPYMAPSTSCILSCRRSSLILYFSFLKKMNHRETEEVHSAEWILLCRRITLLTEKNWENYAVLSNLAGSKTKQLKCYL